MVVISQRQVKVQVGVPDPTLSSDINQAYRGKSGSFIDPTAVISGMVEVGEKSYIGPFVHIAAEDVFRVKLSAEDNLQDNVFVSATTGNTFVGRETSIAHGARVTNSMIGNFVFIGFNARVDHSTIEDGAMVLHGATVMGVTIPQNCIVPPGAFITSEDQTQGLALVEEANIEFKEEVIAVNIELAGGYGLVGPGLNGVSGNPMTSWIAESVIPTLCMDVNILAGARIIGSVYLGVGGAVGKMTSIRGDEGVPIVIGDGAWIGSKVTFHALKGQSIVIGSQLTVGDGAIFHGALCVGDQVTVGANAVLFKSVIGNDCSIGNNAIVIGVTLAEKSIVPDGARVLKQEDADRYLPV